VGLSHYGTIVQAEPKLVAPIPRELTSYREIVKSVVPAVVSIEAKAKPKRILRPREDAKPVEIGFGSGVIVEAKGVILTNFHVIEGAELVEVKLTDGRKFISKDMVGDPKTDLAIVRIQTDKPLPVLEIGDSDTMEVGDRVLAVGAPFGLAGSVTHGIISAKSRNLKLNVYEDFLQTDAAINPGNSGGPLVNLEGKLIGINSAIKSRSGGFQGIGMAISSNLAKTVMQQLLKDGMVKRGYLGVQIRDVDDEVAPKLNVKPNAGVLITRVFEATPGAKGGLKAGDIVTNIGGKAVLNGTELQRVVAALPLGKPVEVLLLRDGQAVTTKITIEEQPESYGLSNREE
jgi:serine protease Do